MKGFGVPRRHAPRAVPRVRVGLVDLVKRLVRSSAGFYPPPMPPDAEITAPTMDSAIRMPQKITAM